MSVVFIGPHSAISATTSRTGRVYSDHNRLLFFFSIIFTCEKITLVKKYVQSKMTSQAKLLQSADMTGLWRWRGVHHAKHVQESWETNAR